MIGNDIVDLRDPENQTIARHPRFDARVFAPDERAMLDEGADGERMRSMLWAAKESAYKFLRRSIPGLVFSPPKYVVRLSSLVAASVEAAGRRVPVRFDACEDYVHCIARDPRMAAEEIIARIVPVAGGQESVVVRLAAIAALAEVLGEDPESLRIERNERIPTLTRRGRAVPGTLSLSHHGRFAAFAWTSRGCAEVVGAIHDGVSGALPPAAVSSFRCRGRRDPGKSPRS